ncbi:MAG TPA: S49 family peptidase [Chlamydiales bacterium]|nr:S49 family peptidase [Chlamydiales bacterium]
MGIVPESIFVSALRTLCKMFFAVCGILLAFFLFFFVYSLVFGTSLVEPKTTMTILPDAQGQREMVSSHAPAILQLNIHGIIGEPAILDSESVRNILLESRTGLLANNRVKGILLHFNTPGGTVVDSDSIYQMLVDYKTKYKVPIYAYVDGLCASGGMYIASSAEKIFASPVSIIGSVGVIFGPFFNLYETLGKIGVQMRTLTEGKDKDAMSPFKQWQEGEDASYKEIMSYFYNRFVEIVTSARPSLVKEKLIHQYGAQIFDPGKAKEYGYIDEISLNRNIALAALLQEAQINPAEPYQVVELEPRIQWFAQLIQGTSNLAHGRIEHYFDLGQPKIRDQFAYLYQPE